MAGAASLSHAELPELAHTASAPAAPCGVATDSVGNYYVADLGAKTITIYAPSDGHQIVSFSTTPFSAAGLCKLAVDSSGRIYTTNNSRNQVLRLKPEGAGFPPTAGTTYALDASVNGNGVLAAGPTGVAGNAGSGGSVAIDPVTQNVYVTQNAGNEVQEYNAPTESYKLKCEGDETAALPSGASTEEIKNALEASPVECTTVTVAAGTSASRVKVTFSAPMGNTNVGAMEVIKAGGNETAYQMFNGAASSHVSSFQPSGVPISNTIGSTVSGANYIGVDIYGKNGNVYVTDKGAGHNKALIFNNAGNTVLAEFNGSDSPTGAFNFANLANAFPAVAVDQSNGHVYVSDIWAHKVVDEFDGAGNFVSQLSHVPPFEEGVSGNGIAVDNGSTSPGKGRIYLTARTEAGGTAEALRGVFAFGPLTYAFPLTVVKEGQGSATVDSTPVGISCGATCKAEFAANSTVTLKALLAFGSVVGQWSGCDAVNSAGECEVAMTGVRKVSVRLDSRPLVSEQAATQITDSSARLEAKVNPKGKATSYHFEYVDEEAWEDESFADATKAPASAVMIGSGTAAVPVSTKVEGLEALTSYHFRVVATNTVGSVEGERAAGTDAEIERSFTTYLPPQVFSGECPANEALRTGPSASLPDCRAYEQASPVDKNGGSIQATASAARTAEDGSTITFESTTGIPGGAGSQNFPTYMAKRSSIGWTTAGLLPSPSSGQRAAVMGWTPDFATVFDRAELLGGGVSMLARSTSAGAQEEMVPHTLPNPEYAYVDSSADSAITIFEAGQQTGSGDGTLQLTPNAAAGQPNVYAWDRNEPTNLRLVGVLPDGSTPAQGSQVGRGIVAEEYNRDSGTVTDDGSAFFNAIDSEGQLYLRLNPTAEETEATDGEGNCVPDSAFACTVQISASQRTNGKGPSGTDSVGPQPAHLKAASPSGLLAVFTSSEKLTNDANTGPEPDAPAIAQASLGEPPCSPAPCEENLGFIPAFANEIAIDEAEEYVYWSDPDHGRIGRAKLDGSSADDDYLTPGGEPGGVAVIDEGSAKYIFWTDRGPLNSKDEPQDGAGTIGRADLDGSSVSADCYEGLTNPRSIAVSASFLYWTNPEFGSIVGVGDIGRAELSCEENGGAKDAQFITGRDANGDIAVDENHIYVSSFFKIDKESPLNRYLLNGDGSGFTPIRTFDAAGPVGVAVDDSHLYWADSSHHKIGRANLDGTASADFIAEAGRALDPAVSTTALFWSTNQGVTANPGSDLYLWNRDSEDHLTDLAPDASGNGIEVQGVLGASEDASYVYFAANGVPDNLAASSNPMGESAAPGNCKGLGFVAIGTCNLYLAYGGHVDFIARLDAANLSGSKDTGDAVDWVAGQGDIERQEQTKSVRVSVDGRVLVFRSRRQLTDYQNEGPRCLSGAEGKGVPGPCLEFYRFEYGQEGLVCLTCDPRQAAPEGPASLVSARPPNIGAPRPAATLSRNLSRDGNRLFFESADSLVAGDINGEGGCFPWGSPSQVGNTCQDVYEWEAPGIGSCEESSSAYSPLNQGCLYLISSGKRKEASFFADADPGGNNVFIYTYDQLVPQDQDELLDAYDVRVGGGLASQHSVEAEPCGEGDCKPVPSTPPATQSPNSAGYVGPPDLEPQRAKQHKKHKHVKHKRRGKGHKARHGKGQAQQKRRAAKQNGRAGR